MLFEIPDMTDPDLPQYSTNMYHAKANPCPGITCNHFNSSDSDDPIVSSHTNNGPQGTRITEYESSTACDNGDTDRDHCCRKTITRRNVYTNYFENTTPKFWTETTYYRRTCGGYILVKSSDSNHVDTTVKPCAVTDENHCHETLSSSRKDSTTVKTVCNSSICTDTTTRTTPLDSHGNLNQGLTPTEVQQVCNIMYEGHPAIMTDTRTTTSDNSTLARNVVATINCLHTGYSPVTHFHIGVEGNTSSE
ncbi:hypothetical protein SARC_05598 [Sphaeroforma arctica JP610]|uniref:Uncharacterized protein n=1 Tax=Sphaeroforma arctica JP610 TaxID=667725 RepID=A0A0L0FZT2_9EUKA|nr:hypothetical protein SARC_05598 [Sphaeroforma arctica JP610]KNC82109.1 hypothetical protein SARC_05598 [Sphaeroforma arctica JP610]|eukprot:XP_014156011.1 hypothetical protein SARC_05598 [Sphaeroforma arctica JP610]